MGAADTRGGNGGRSGVPSRGRSAFRRGAAPCPVAAEPATGSMLSALWESGKNRLVLIVHHLAVDAVSWRILLEDFNIAWAQHHGGQAVELPSGGVVCPVGDSAR